MLSDPQWRTAFVALSIGAIAILALFWEAASRIVVTWHSSSTFNHGFMILPICFYLVWIRRAQLAAAVARPQPTYWGLVPVAMAAAVWLLGDVADVLLVQQFAMVGMLQGLVLTVLGWRATRVLIFPLFYLLFAVPFGRFLIPSLQDITAIITVDLIRLINIPVFLDGLFITIPTGRFVVAEVCSGVRFLIATLALGFLFANLTYRTLWRRLLLIALAVAVPIVANGVRAFGIIYLAYLTNNRLAAGVDHIVYGWIFFAIVTIVLLAIGMTFRERTAYDGADGNAPMENPSGGRTPGGPERLSRIGIAAVCAVLVAAAAPAYSDYIGGVGDTALRAPLTAPAAGGGWRELEDYRDTWRPRYRGADATVLRTYVKDGRSVHLFIAYYTHQRQGAEVVSEVNKIVGGRYWARAGGGGASAMVEGARLPVRMTRMLNRGRGRVAWQWYWIGGRYTADPLFAKVLEAKVRLLGGTRAGAAIAVATDYEDLPAEAVPVLRDFLRNAGPMTPIFDRMVGR